MRTAKQYWQYIVNLLKQFTTPRSRALERELSDLRRDYRELGLRASTLASEGDTVRKTLEKAKQQIDSVHAELSGVYEERDQLANALRKQLESLETGIRQVQDAHKELVKDVAEHDREFQALASNVEAPLNEVRAELAQLQSRQRALETDQSEYDRRLGTLETESETQRAYQQELLTSLNTLEQKATKTEQHQRNAEDQNRTLAAELADMHAAFEASENSNGKQLADLALQLGDIDADRASTRERLLALQNALTDAASRHSDTQRNIKALEGELDGDRKTIQAQLNNVEEKLARMQIEQESLINTQSGLTDSMRKNRRWATAAVGIAFLLVVVAGVTKIRDGQRQVPELAVVTDDAGQPSESPPSQPQPPAQQDPSRQTVEAVESAAFETETMVPGQAEATAADASGNGQPQNRDGPPTEEAAPRAAETPADTAIPAVNDPLSDKAQPGNGGAAIGVTEPGKGEAATSEESPAQPAQTPSQALAAAQFYETKAFFEENAEKEGVVSLPSGLQYRVLKRGRGKSPGDSDLVILHYRGRLPDGREFDSSYREKAPAAYRVDQVIAGWREALQRMQEGAQWELYIPPELAHGAATHDTPGFLPLIYQIELIAVSETATP